ncbi:hypothetical protein L345_06832, partial [Ophiophagus hannah]
MWLLSLGKIQAFQPGGKLAQLPLVEEYQTREKSTGAHRKQAMILMTLIWEAKLRNEKMEGGGCFIQFSQVGVLVFTMPCRRSSLRLSRIVSKLSCNRFCWSATFSWRLRIQRSKARRRYITNIAGKYDKYTVDACPDKDET